MCEIILPTYRTLQRIIWFDYLFVDDEESSDHGGKPRSTSAIYRKCEKSRKRGVRRDTQATLFPDSDEEEVGPVPLLRDQRRVTSFGGQVKRRRDKNTASDNFRAAAKLIRSAATDNKGKLALSFEFWAWRSDDGINSNYILLNTHTTLNYETVRDRTLLHNFKMPFNHYRRPVRTQQRMRILKRKFLVSLRAHSW